MCQIHTTFWNRYRNHTPTTPQCITLYFNRRKHGERWALGDSEPKRTFFNLGQPECKTCYHFTEQSLVIYLLSLLTYWLPSSPDCSNIDNFKAVLRTTMQQHDIWCVLRFINIKSVVDAGIQTRWRDRNMSLDVFYNELKIVD